MRSALTADAAISSPLSAEPWGKVGDKKGLVAIPQSKTSLVAAAAAVAEADVAEEDAPAPPPPPASKPKTGKAALALKRDRVSLYFSL